MTSNRLITLLSDFGLNDVYVGVMKGVIAHVNPTLTIIDLTHEVPPQNIQSAQFSLMSAYPYFPPETVHVAVVDPGVGSTRRPIAVERADGILIGPDNGIFTGLLDQAIQVVELTRSSYWRVSEPSNTFHGRDIFAAVAAHIASGVSFSEVGEPIDPALLVQRPLPICVSTAAGIVGSVQHIDRFGNVITNIPGNFVQNQSWSIAIGKRIIPGCRTYEEVNVSEPLALVGSHGWVEIAVNGGDAYFQLRLNWENSIELLIAE